MVLLIYLPFRYQRSMFYNFVKHKFRDLKCIDVKFDYRDCPVSVFCSKSFRMVDVLPDGFYPVCNHCNRAVDTRDWNERHIFCVNPPDKNMLAIGSSFDRSPDSTLDNPSLDCLFKLDQSDVPEFLIQHINFARIANTDDIYDDRLSGIVNVDKLEKYLCSSEFNDTKKKYTVDQSKMLVKRYFEHETALSYGSPI